MGPRRNRRQGVPQQPKQEDAEGSVGALRGRLEEHERRFRLLDQETRALERERQKLSAVVNNTDAGFLAFDSSLRLVWTNLTFMTRFWTDPGAGRLLGSMCNRVLCERPTVCEECPAARPFKTGAVAHHEMRLP